MSWAGAGIVTSEVLGRRRDARPGSVGGADEGPRAGRRCHEPPDWIQPVRHALGAALLQTGRPAEAERVYRDDLARLPENGWSLFGLARSLEWQGRHDEAARVRARFDEVWEDADVGLSSSCFCLPGT